MFERAKAYMRRRMMQIQAAKMGPTPNPGTMDVVHYGDHVGPKFAKGAVTIQKQPVDPVTREPVGPWQTIEFDDNLVVTQAELLMAQMAIGAANSALNYIELGDPAPTATPPQLNDVNLEQTTGSRKAALVTAAGSIVTAEALWDTADGNGFTFTEAGLFTGPFGSGSMFARKTFAGIFKTSAFKLRFTWLITFLVAAQGAECAGIALTGPSTVASHTIYNSTAGGEVSVAATFDFTPNSNLLDVYLNGQRLVPTVHYVESGAPLGTPQGGGVPGVSKGVNLTFTLNPGDDVLLVHRAIL